MLLAVLAYPDLSEADRIWIEEIRALHDELQKGVVNAHFTLVFPVDGIDVDTLTNHVRRSAAIVAGFPFVLSSTRVVDDAFRDYWHTFLVPGVGYSEIVDLHDRLYRGPLASFARVDIPYIPHVGVGNSKNELVCQELADRLEAEGMAIQGRVEAVEIVSYDGRHVKTIERVPLRQM